MGQEFNNLTPEDLCDLMCGKPEEDTDMYECFHCGMQSVIWDADFDFADMGYEGEGIVNCCHCTNCGAEIEYRVKSSNEEEK